MTIWLRGISVITETTIGVFSPLRRLVMPLINKTFLSCLISCKEKNIVSDIGGM